MKIISFAIFYAFFGLFAFAQTNPIEVYNSSLKVSGEEILRFGFAEGDQIIFSFEELKGKEFKEIEIIELTNNTSKFLEFNTKKIDKKTIRVGKKAIYAFRFKESAVFGNRTCKISIHRVPDSPETVNFNSEVTQTYQRDTTYGVESKNVIVGYDTSYVTEEKQYFVKNEVVPVQITGKQAVRVHSSTNGAGNRTYFFVDLPYDLSYWVYSIGVSQEARKQLQGASEAVADLAKKSGSLISNFNFPVAKEAGLAVYGLGHVISFAKPVTKENVYYAFASTQLEAQKFMANQPFMAFKGGVKLAFDYGRVDLPKSGRFFVLLMNDNTFTGVEVDLNIVGYKTQPVYETRKEKRQVIKDITAPKMVHFRRINSTYIWAFYEEVKAEKNKQSQIEALRKEIQSYEKQRNYEKCVAKAKELTTLSSSDDAYNTLGWYLLLNKQYDEAVEALSVAIQKNPHNLLALCNLANTYMMKGENGKAKGIYLEYKDHYSYDKIPWEKMVQMDFQTFVDNGMVSEQMSEIRKLLGLK